MAKSFNDYPYLGSARVPRAVDGVAPSTSSNHLFPPYGESVCEQELRRDAANNTPEACTPDL
jgi:hypothetical protein